MADLVLWEPAFFGAKPKMVLKGGMIVWAQHGRPERLAADAAADVLPADVRRLRLGAAKTCVTFVSRAALRGGYRRAATACRRTGPAGLRHPGHRQARTWSATTYLPDIEVDPQTFAVTVDGVHATVAAAEDDLRLNQLYFFS